MRPQSLDYLFANRYYAGILVDPWTREEYSGRHVPMVTAEVFARVQQVIAGRSRAVPHQKFNPEFPLRGLVRCAVCRGALTAGFSRGRRSMYPYYFCMRAECSRYGRSLRAGDVHREFIEFLTEIAPRPALMKSVRERIITGTHRQRAVSDAGRRVTERRVRRIEQQTTELIRMRAANLITDDEFLTQKHQLILQRAALQKRAEHHEKPEQIKADLDQIAAPLAALPETWRSLEQAFRRRFERLILPGGYVVEEIRTADMGRLFSSFGMIPGRLTGEVPLTFTHLNLLLSEIHEFREVIGSVRRQDDNMPEAA